MGKHFTSIVELPETIPVFPLAGALLLPHTDLPLNIFEPRYLEMVETAMAGQRLIGMIQPMAGDSSETPALSAVGCLGRIISYSESRDDRLQIVLEGVCRFRVVREAGVATPYRQAHVSYSDFAADLSVASQANSVNRPAVIKAFRQYLEANNMTANWEEVDRIPSDILVNTLSQLAPYDAAEKQALLEADDVQTRADMLIALTELALSKPAGKMRLQ
ncbi:MAG: LON peptidase substrate-binding domain-containing protein [Hyphomicrobiales bacterium]